MKKTAGAIALAAVCLLTVMTTATVAETLRIHPRPGLGDYDLPFYPNGTYRTGVQSPTEFLGYPLGSSPASHTEIVSYFEYLAETFDNASLHEYARTYEGRPLVYLVIASEENAERMDEIRAGLAKLADPRRLDGRGEATRIIDASPAVAWMAYGIHGDELSSCDAALQLAYQLLAGTDEATRDIVDNVIVIIDPLQNPDGRARWLGQLEQLGGVVPSRDTQSLHHRGWWPWGRGNHYLFDLNRDWFATVHPETRGRTSAILEWMPHYLLDCHEMGATNSYLFSPPREPFNPYMTDYIYKWWARVAESHADAFDRYGWSYYTREWNEEFFPGYGSSWGIYLGAIGMLFEQAGVDGSVVKRREGTVMTYRETVHHQFIGSVANLAAVAEGREELLTDYYNEKRANLDSRAAAYLFPPTPNRSRFEQLGAKLRHQRIEVEVADEAFEVSRATAWDGGEVRNRSFPEGTIIVRTNQPLRNLVEVILAFDLRIPTDFLETEKKEILKKGGTRLYDATAWSMAHAYGLAAYRTASLPRVATTPFAVAAPDGGLSAVESPVGFAFDGSDDRAYHLLARLLERGCKVWTSKKPFDGAGRTFPRGSFLLRANANPDLEPAWLDETAREAGVRVYGVDTQLGGTNADLGGEEFTLLKTPRIAIAAGYPLSIYSFGSVWHLLDSRFEMRTTTLDVARLARGTDLDKYNVLVLPHAWAFFGSDYKHVLGDAAIKKIGDWVSSGGTLIAIGSAAAFAADSSVALSKVRLRRQSLGDLDKYAGALAAYKAGADPEVDSLAVWEAQDAAADKTETDSGANARPDIDKIKLDDETARKLFPRGAILRVDLDPDHWLTSGCGESVPVMFNTNYAYLTMGGVEVPGRLAESERLRLGGLLWPEARTRWNETAYVTREAKGKGQIILFATAPNFRGYFLGSERLLINALLLGPGCGTRTTLEW